MRIGIVIEIFYPIINGVLTSSVNLAHNLMDQGHEVVFIASSWSRSTVTLIDGRIPVRYAPAHTSWAYPGLRNVLPWSRFMKAMMRRERLDLLHITGLWLLTRAAVRSACALKLPVVHTFHTMLHEPTYILYFFKLNCLVPLIRVIAWRYYGLFVRHCTINTGPSRMVVRQLQRHFPRSEVRYVSNGVDLSTFDAPQNRRDFRKRYPAHTDRTLIFVGRLGDEKSVDQLIDAAARVTPHHPDFRLFIVGDGPKRSAYEVQARRLGLQRHVVFIGRVPHGDLLTSGLLHYSRAFVTASITENQPMTVIEAICCGVPSIVADIRGITELVEHNGITFRAGDVADLADAMIRMITDDALHAACSLACEGMRRRYDGREVAQRFIRIYHDALARG